MLAVEAMHTTLPDQPGQAERGARSSSSDCEEPPVDGTWSVRVTGHTVAFAGSCDDAALIADAIAAYHEKLGELPLIEWAPVAPGPGRQ